MSGILPSQQTKEVHDMTFGSFLTFILGMSGIIAVMNAITE